MIAMSHSSLSLTQKYELRGDGDGRSDWEVIRSHSVTLGLCHFGCLHSWPIGLRLKIHFMVGIGTPRPLDLDLIERIRSDTGGGVVGRFVTVYT